MCVDINTLKRISLSWMISIVNHLNHYNHAGLRDCKLLMTHAYVVNLTVRSLLIQQQIGEYMCVRMYVCVLCKYICMFVCVCFMYVCTRACVCVHCMRVYECVCLNICLCEYKVLEQVQFVLIYPCRLEWY